MRNSRSCLHNTHAPQPGPASPSKENTLTLHVSDTDAIEVHDVFVGDLSHHAGCLKEGLWENRTKECEGPDSSGLTPKGVCREENQWAPGKLTTPIIQVLKTVCLTLRAQRPNPYLEASLAGL